MSGALAERVFVQKLEGVGFEDVEVLDRFDFALDRAARYPLFTKDLVDLMYRLIPAENRQRVALSVVIGARLPG